MAQIAQIKGLLSGSTLSLLSVVAIGLAGACGPSSRTNVTVDAGIPGDIDAGPCVPVPEGDPVTCGDAIDNDCDGVTDCADPSCSGIGACPVCGSVTKPIGSPLPLPDGTCEMPEMGCTPYTSTLNFVGFGANQTMTAESDIQYVCAKLEHSWVRDLEIELVSPDNKIVELSKYAGHNGGEVFLGEPVAADDNQAGVGYKYCFEMGATRAPFLDFANANPTVKTLPATSYRPSTPFANMIGSKLNGPWSIRVTDIWGADNGFLFEWEIAFNPELLKKCDVPIVN
jgi:hypothetical protein